MPYINRAGQLYAFFMRSNVAHATIKKIDVSKALTCEGVAAIYTGDDIAADGVGGPICGWTPTNRDGSAPKEPPHPLLARSKVRYVGDHIAVVIAESLEQARSAAEKITIDLDVLPPVVDLSTSTAANSSVRLPGRRYTVYGSMRSPHSFVRMPGFSDVCNPTMRPTRARSNGRRL